jgi:hypothetical protein
VATRDSSDSPYVSTDQYRDESDLKKYRTEIPNMIFDIGLTPYEVALYGHSRGCAGPKRAASAGRASARSQEKRACPPGACRKRGRTRPTRSHPHEAAEGAGDQRNRNNRGPLASEHGAVFG